MDKYWLVSEVRDDTLLLLTRRGKQRVVSKGDPCLRLARWWERIFYRSRFPQKAERESKRQAVG